MKLDRNTNPDGRGKYALINLRDNTVQWGNEPGGQFFVLKYKDLFVYPALLAYAKAVRDAASQMDDEPKQQREYLEYADEMDAQAELAFKAGEKLPD